MPEQFRFQIFLKLIDFLAKYALIFTTFYFFLTRR